MDLKDTHFLSQMIPQNQFPMDSDSDSDGSHVSATPPRDSFPPPPQRKTPPLSRKITSSSSHSKLKASTQPPPQEAPTPSSSPPAPPPPTPLFTNLPFRICESKPAAFSSSTSSFSRLRSRASLNSDEKLKSDGVDFVPEPPQVEVIAPPKSVRRKPPNLITDTVTSPPVKPPVFRSSGNGEGNFVKLNLNGKRGKKFPSKYKGVSKSRSNYAFRGKRYKKKEANGEGESLLEEESDLQKQREEEDNGFISLIEDAILAVKTEASDENLTKLLNLVYGYDSFRDGQLQAIKMVIGGSSTMLVLPTGAGKSLCYQIPAMILPGITLVVSPLVSLMIDQLKHLPSIIKGGLLSSSQVCATKCSLY